MNTGSDEEPMDDPIFGGPSYLNDGLGIKVKLVFYPLENAESRKRKNAKRLVVNKMTQAHEDYELRDFLVAMCNELDYVELLDSSLLFGSTREPDQNSFDATYGITGTSNHDICLANERDFARMMTEVKGRARPALVVTLTQNEVHDPDADNQENQDQGPTNDGAEEPGEDEDEDDEEGHGRKKKRKKTYQPSEEEQSQAEKIVNLEDQHVCQDRRCPNYRNFCLPVGPNGEHLFLLPKHFRFWSAAMEAGIEGVSVDHPPNTPLFDADQLDENQDTTDISLLAKRRARNTSNSSGGQVQVNFEGLANLVAELRGNTNEQRVPLANVANAASRSLSPAIFTTPVLPPKMSLSDFCFMHDLPDELQAKLNAMDISGPHLLRKISDVQLSDGGLSVGQVAAVRDAEDRYMAAE